MTYEQVFEKVKKSFLKAAPSNFTDSFAFQFNITGEGEGIFYACFKNGKLAVEPYDYRDRDVIFTADANTLIAIAEGKLEPAVAIKDGKLTADGDQSIARQLMGFIPVKKPAAKKEQTKASEKHEEKTVKAAKVTEEDKPAKASEKVPAKLHVKNPADRIPDAVITPVKPKTSKK